MAVYTDPAYTEETYVGEEPDGVTPLQPRTITSEQVVNAPEFDGTALQPGTIDDGQTVNPPVFPPSPDLIPLLTPAPIASAEVVNGPLIFPPEGVPLDIPGIPVGPAMAPATLTVTGYPEALQFWCQPQLNDVGTAEVMIQREPGSLVMGEIVGFNLLGQRVFTGRVGNRVDTIHDDGEEATETLVATIDGMLREWEYSLVYPDFGAFDVSLIGAPTQDTRIFDWTMNGLGVDTAEGVAGVNIRPSIGGTNRYGTPDELFPLPDVWPAPEAKWMWVTDPYSASQPSGWCHFREPFGAYKGRLQVWCCAYDYAEVYMDGVPLLTCDEPGVAQHIDLDVKQGFHLLTIRCYNNGGKAGVLAAVLPVNADTGLYDQPYRLSGGGWKSLAYPSRSFRLNPGQVIRRLLAEARSRGVRDFENWQLDFNETYDSAGRPWPEGDPIVIEVGATYLDVLNLLAEDRVDYAASPAQRRLRMWVKGEGTGNGQVPDPWGNVHEYDSLVREQTLR